MTDDSPIRIYVNKIENRITFKIETGYYLEFLSPIPVKLLWSFKNKVIKDEIGKKLRHLEITELELFLCNIVNND